MRKWLIILISVLIMGGCSTVLVQVDYDPEHNFSSLSTFNVVYTKKGDEKDFTRERISKLLSKYMQNRGYINTPKDKADFYITMHLDIQTKSQVETNYEAMGIGNIPSMYVGLNNTTIGEQTIVLALEPDTRVTTQTYEYEEGRVVFEVFDVKESRVVWQGIAKDELSMEYNQQQKTDYINSVIDKLFKDFPTK
jgi:hypothetical protein